MSQSQVIPIEVLKTEDKIYGSLSLTQASLLSLPIIAAIFLLFLPPAGQLPTYKMLLIFLVFILSGLLALRIKQRLILSWLILIGRYNQRPKSYIKQQLPLDNYQAVISRLSGLMTDDIKSQSKSKAAQCQAMTRKTSHSKKQRT